MKKFQIAFVGINSLYGSTSALLLKQSPFIKCLKLFDPRDVESGEDVANINTQCKVKTYQGHDQLENAFREADIIVISDESNEMIDNDAQLMNVSANLTKYAKAISRASPGAIIVVASPPVNCLLPMMSQLLAKAGCYNHNKIVGSTSVDTMRASALLANRLNLDPKDVVLPVIGGSSEFTRVPVFSQSRPHFSLRKDMKNNLIMDIRRGDRLVLANKGSPEALNRAYSTVQFLNTIMAGLRGEPNATQITMSRTDLVPGVEYFSLPVLFGREGIIKRFGLPSATDGEEEMVEEAVKHVKKDIDKADYIVKGSVGFSDHQNLSSNERSSSQKEIFDLFVKSLPKPQDKQQPAKEDVSKKATDYSFKSLIKEDSPKGPFEAFDNKSHRPTLSDKLKNVTSPDSFLKSAGCFTSPLQKPILILEPLGCPSRPMETDEEREVEEFLETGDVLHENNLARFRENTRRDSRARNSGPAPTNQSFLSADVLQQRTVDPIANFKAQVAKFHEYRKPSQKPIVEDKEHPGCDANEEKHPPEIKTKCSTTNMESKKKKSKALNDNKSSTPKPKKAEICEELYKIPNEKEIHFSSPSGRCLKKKYSSNSKKSDSFVFDIKTNQMIPPYNLYKKGKSAKVDYVPEEENGRAYMPNNENDESLYHRGRAEAVNDENYNKLVSRLFKKLNGLNSESYFPLKVEDRVGTPRCKKSFTESAVRCRSSNSRSQKIRKKQRRMMNPTESENNEEVPQDHHGPKRKRLHSEEEDSQKKRHSKKGQREMAKFKDIEDDALDSHQEVEEGELFENKEVQFVCPKCQIKVTCQPEKKAKETEKKVKEAESPKPERVVSEIPQDERKPKRNVIMKTYKVRDSHFSAQNDVFGARSSFEMGIQEERLRKLKEKINKKLIPMMRQSNESNSKADHETPSEAKDKTRPGESGTPLVLVRNSEPENEPRHLEEPSVRSDSHKWQGVPYVVRQEKKEVNDGKNRAVFMKVVIPPPFRESTKGGDKTEENPIQKGSDKLDVGAEYTVKGAGESENAKETLLKMLENNRKSGKRAAKLLNKLQLLELEGKRKLSMIEESNNETKCRNKNDRFLKEQIRREVIPKDLKTDDVQNYMMARSKGSRKTAASERSMKEENQTSKVFETTENNLKSDVKKDISPDISESKPADNSQMGFSVNKLEQSIILKKEAEDAINESKNISDNKQSVQAESKALSDDKSRKDAGNESKAEKSVAKESNWAMTSPSKNFENIEHPVMPTNRDGQMNAAAESNKDQTESEQAVKRSNTVLKTTNGSGEKTSQHGKQSTKSSFEPNFVVPLRASNKLQLLAKVRNAKQSDNSDFQTKLQRKLKNVWEKVLSPKAAQPKFEFAEMPRSLKHVGAAFDVLDKKSAAVKMAPKPNHSAPKKPSLYRTKAAPNNVAILEGLTFPVRRKRKATNNLLKEIDSARQQVMRKPVKPEKPKANLKGVVKRVAAKPLPKLLLRMKGRYEGVKPGRSLEPESSEYAQDVMQMAKLASEIMKKKTLRSAVEVKNRGWSGSRDPVETDKNGRRVQKPQHPKPYVSVDRRRPGLPEQVKDRKRAKADKTFDVANKLMSMPHVRHQVENFELPLGPLEVRPGLAQFSCSKVLSPNQLEGSWESAVFNEYSRSSALPSLRDTRETFYLEERPS